MRTLIWIFKFLISPICSKCKLGRTSRDYVHFYQDEILRYLIVNLWVVRNEFVYLIKAYLLYKLYNNTMEFPFRTFWILTLNDPKWPTLPILFARPSLGQQVQLSNAQIGLFLNPGIQLILWCADSIPGRKVTNPQNGYQ